MKTIAFSNPTQPMERLATVGRCTQGETLYHQEDCALFWYRILSGAARKHLVMVDGRRQIVDFLFPGDLFGFGTRDEHHCFSVEVIVPDTLVARYPRKRIEMLAEADPAVARLVRETAFESIERLQRRLILLNRTTALSKVSSFLLEIANRSGARPAQAMLLPMSRYDIADYLAMAVETVSRTLTELRRRRAIALGGARLVRIVDREALERAAYASKGQGMRALALYPVL